MTLQRVCLEAKSKSWKFKKTSKIMTTAFLSKAIQANRERSKLMHVNQHVPSIQDPYLGHWVLDLSPRWSTWQSTSPVSSGVEQFPVALGLECCSKLPETWKNLEEKHQDLMLSLKGQIYVSNAQSFHILLTCSTWKNIWLET